MSESNNAALSKSPSSHRGPTPREALDSFERVAGALSGLQYGEVRVIVQDGFIVQIERTEKQRLR
jgi:hypothetical protein